MNLVRHSPDPANTDWTGMRAGVYMHFHIIIIIMVVVLFIVLQLEINRN